MRRLLQRSGRFCDGWAYRTSRALNDHKHDQESFHQEFSQDFHSRLAGGRRSGRRRILSLNRVARAGWRVCAKRNTSSRCLARPIWVVLDSQVDVLLRLTLTSQLFVFQGVFRQIAKTDLPMEKANTRSMNRDIGTK